MMKNRKEQLIKALKITAVRSSGAGGQHVNKVSSKIVLRFDLLNTTVFNTDEKALLRANLKNKLSAEDILIISSQATRSQHKNKEIAIEKLMEMLTVALKVKPKRKASKPSRKSVIKRLEKKAKQALKKANRRKGDWG